jgi:hypothetical protein
MVIAVSPKVDRTLAMKVALNGLVTHLCGPSPKVLPTASRTDSRKPNRHRAPSVRRHRSMSWSEIGGVRMTRPVTIPVTGCEMKPMGQRQLDLWVLSNMPAEELGVGCSRQILGVLDHQPLDELRPTDGLRLSRVDVADHLSKDSAGYIELDNR